ncbi:MAG: CBO0543 family protein [Desulfotomaculaceae bacterium]
MLLAVLFIPWLVWWKYVDKKRLLEITLLGALVLIIASYLDAVISEFGLWSYNYEIIPVWPRLISADFTVLPVTYMFIYQYFQEWKKFLLAMVIASTLFAFVGEPFLQWLNIYNLHEWKHVYSFPIYIFLGLFVKWFVQMMLARSIR